MDSSITRWLAARHGRALTGLVVLSAFAVAGGYSTCVADSNRVSDDFEKRVRPLLVTHCYECHGPQSAGEGGLRLDSIAAILRGGASGRAVVPEQPGRSLLVHAVQHEPSVEAMPPDKRLTNVDISTIVSWVNLSAEMWPKSGPEVRPRVRPDEITDSDRSFWAFLPPVERAPPGPTDRDWISNPIDAFVLAELANANLTPSPAADRPTLIRRATWDLHGLPPTPEEVESFVRDGSPDAWARLIERLLTSPSYGEKWGRHWLDVARYSDSNGMDDNIAWADAWRYRDYVIAAFNSDKPYDRFVREQIAGDLLEDWSSPRRAEGVVATTFLLLGPKMPSADDPVKQQLDIVDEQLDTVGRVFMGLTLGCARCHAHKFDPISSRDYYALAGIFRSTRSMLGFRVDSKFNLTALADRAANEELSRHEREMDRHDDVLVNGNRLDMTSEQRKQHSEAVDAAYDHMAKIPAAMAVEDAEIADMPILLLGNHLTPAQIVRRGVPLVLTRGQQPFEVAADESGRRELSEWMTHPAHASRVHGEPVQDVGPKDHFGTDRNNQPLAAHPLTARVMVNRIWCWHFGQGLVRSVDNFGRLGQRPDNQPLLDWIAVRFMRSGWSVKDMHRLIMLSSTYRQESAMRPVHTRDPENRRLWRMNPRRLTAEELRDSLLFLSGRLDQRMGGRTLPIRNHKIMNTGEIARCNAVHQQPRRTVYLPVIRSGLHELLKTFDFPDPSVPAGRRSSTTVAPQALFMMNSLLVTRSARDIATRLLDMENSDRKRIRLAIRLIQSREATSNEVETWQQFLAARQTLPSVQPEDGSPNRSGQSRLDVWESVARVLLSSNEFMYVK